MKIVLTFDEILARSLQLKYRQPNTTSGKEKKMTNERRSRMRKEKRHMSDLFFDQAEPNEKNERCKECERRMNYLKNGQCYDCFFGFTYQKATVKKRIM